MNKYLIFLLIVNFLIGVALVYPLLFIRIKAVQRAPVKQKVIYKLEISLLLKALLIFTIVFFYGLLFGTGLIVHNAESVSVLIGLTIAVLTFL